MLGASLADEKNERGFTASAETSERAATKPRKSYRSDAIPVSCANCKQVFQPNRSSRRFCSPSCRKRAWDKKAVIKAVRAQFNAFMDGLEAGL